MGFVRRTTYYTGVVYEWNLPTGWTCPQAKTCLVYVDRATGKQDNRSQDYRCYAAAAERFPSAREARWRNFVVTRSGPLPELPRGATAVRIHASGDFYSQGYFDQWLAYADDHPGVRFWAFTKSIGFWVRRLDEVPNNLVLTASLGGWQDSMAHAYHLRHARVVASREEAARWGLDIDTNDDLAREHGPSFALLDKRAARLTQAGGKR